MAGESDFSENVGCKSKLVQSEWAIIWLLEKKEKEEEDQLIVDMNGNGGEQQRLRGN